MVYKAIGLMSGSSLDGLDIAYVHLQETAGKWTYEIVHTQCRAYPAEWVKKLSHAISLSAVDYQLLHTAYGHFTGAAVRFAVANYGLQKHHERGCKLNNLPINASFINTKDS